MARPVYVLQPSFASGYISPEVANRCDLDKYKGALTLAKNCYIRPYGPAYKRGGMMYCCETKNNGACILVPFSVNTSQDYLLEIGDKYIRVHQNGEYLGVELSTMYGASDLQKLRFTQSADEMYITSGEYPVQKLVRTSTGWSLSAMEFKQIYFDASVVSAYESKEEIKVTPSATTGNITLTSDKDLFSSYSEGAYMQLTQNVPSKSSKVSNRTTDELLVGESWKIMTGGTWTGTVTVQYKLNDDWKELRSYQSTDNFNVTDSGTVTEDTTIRAVASISSGTCTMTLQTLPYDKSGFVKITKYNSSKSVDAHVEKELGTTDATKDYSWGVWSEEFGYPSCACFFQNRLCFAASKKQPYAVWMSRTGDYNNFEVESASGEVLDDSAVAASFISRKQQKIMHMIAGVDLMVLTEGSEWLVSGSEVVSPSNITPRMQATRGCNNCEPLAIGNRILFVQGRGSTVRDMGYTYESDSYVGQDLTILANDLVRDYEIVDITYKQEPNSMVYCVRQKIANGSVIEGDVVCLSYIREQEVYAWSEIDTDGIIEAVCCIGEGDEDVVYTVVKRGNKRYIEYFCNDTYTDNAQDYVVLDSAVVDPQKNSDGAYVAAHLKGMTIDVLADGRVHKNIEVDSDDGTFTIPAAADHIIAGLPYTMRMELPNVEIQLGDGSMQGRKKTITGCMLRLRKSLGGRVGVDFSAMDDIKYNELSDTSDIQVFTGDKQVTVPMGGYDYYGKLAVESSDPYPFMLMCAVRALTFGG